MSAIMRLLGGGADSSSIIRVVTLLRRLCVGTKAPSSPYEKLIGLLKSQCLTLMEQASRSMNLWRHGQSWGGKWRPCTCRNNSYWRQLVWYNLVSSESCCYQMSGVSLKSVIVNIKVFISQNQSCVVRVYYAVFFLSRLFLGIMLGVFLESNV